MTDPVQTPLIPEQRREFIFSQLRRDSVLSIRQLTSMLGVSHMTIRRDIAALEDQGKVISTPGGAKIASRLVVEPSRTVKAMADVEQKTAISAHAASLIRDSMTVYVDAGTTLHPLPRFLKDRRDLTVVTNDLAIAHSLMDLPGVEIIMTGGQVEKRNQSSTGRLAALTLRELSIDLAFLTTSSWEIKRGVTIPTEFKVEPKLAAMRSASEVVLAAASTKYGSAARYRVCGLEELDLVVTDAGLTAEQAADLDERGIEVAVAAPLG
ncbi:DeoR/GlpR family DNA-binding transcription regulator [Rothia sp. AR01]|uniref:DeoR/GlpR family DNA-binding transcription regulator n=1 Tax=Rothia santali TaxID=2949643 RepID=A0A9X2KJC8_9MICC|nr:DeoR/GlpR family DNA-binding transcription regulator [Rothia santali]MCP3427088.1 DeoR/GlpR family DNA-binding transcription regulator [Rothia santali]